MRAVYEKQINRINNNVLTTNFDEARLLFLWQTKTVATTAGWSWILAFSLSRNDAVVASLTARGPLSPCRPSAMNDCLNASTQLMIPIRTSTCTST